MPPKRKAMAETGGNKSTTSSRNAKASKISAGSTAPEESAKSKDKDFKYCNGNTLSKKPTYMNLQWPNLADFIKDKNQDMPKPGELMTEYCCRVSDLGIPVSEDGMKVCEKLSKEYEKRDQDAKGMCMYNDWNGWGMGEVMENLLKDFNRDIFKKTISPFKKWGYVEGLAAFLMTADLMYWMGNEDGDSVKEVVNMLGVMIFTTFDAISEHDLFKLDSEIKNIGIASLLFLEFLQGEGCDLDCEWGCEVVRLCDQAGVDLEKEVRKQVSVSKKNIKELRKKYEEKVKGYNFGEEDEKDENAYQTFAEKKDWKPKDDWEDTKYGPERSWYRWDWALEYPAFHKNHKGGNRYDLTKWSKKDREEHTLGTKAFSRRIGIEEDSDEDEWSTVSED